MNQQTLSPLTVSGINVIGLQTLIRKETGRFMNVYLQTIIAPVVTTILFLSIFVVAFGDHKVSGVEVDYLRFLVPGLVMMAILQNAFANTSSSILISKVQGNIVDVLMPPLSAGELLTGFAVGGVLRGLLVGLACTTAVAFFVPVGVHSVPMILASALLGSLMMALLGIAGGLWSEKFDHLAAMSNFIITPLTFLSGTFYSLSQLAEPWREIARHNPFFHIIDMFRYGFTGHTDGSLAEGMVVLAATNILLVALCYSLLKTGYRVKA